jgi:hypothetical protein
VGDPFVVGKMRGGDLGLTTSQVGQRIVVALQVVAEVAGRLSVSDEQEAHVVSG